RNLAKAFNAPCLTERLDPPRGKGESWEEAARTQRQVIYERLARERLPETTLVLTAHHADDQAETLLWRLFTGTSLTHGGGIRARHGAEFRPLLRVRKATLKAYLEEEDHPWREDATNHEGRFLRSRMRRELIPAITKIFPDVIEKLARLALEVQS